MQTNKKIIHTLILMSFLFFSIITYLTYFELFTKEKIINSPYNRRQFQQEESTLRGSILDRNKKVLASSKIDSKNRQERFYPYGALYSHLIGYSSKTYGKSCLELNYNKQLLNISEYSSVFGIDKIQDKLSATKRKGNNLILTIDHKLQQKANTLLQGKKGAVVAMVPKTGEILAMVSKPDFDPNSESLSDHWREMVESSDSPFLARATQGLYVPGSTYKVVTSALALENGMGDRSFEDKGSITIDGKIIRNFGGNAYGTLDLKGALAHSSNVAFSQLGVDLGARTLKDMAARLGFNQKIPFDLPMNKSVFPYKAMHKTDMAAVGMGQGKLLVTPLHMAMITSGIANGGMMMKPYFVSQVTSPTGEGLEKTSSSSLSKIMDAKTAAQVTEMMEAVVTSGTGGNAAIRGIRVAGKTGTAENELSGKQRNKEHAWFIGFAPADNPKIAVAVILEYSGSTGGKIAAPIARDLMASWLGKE
ncbi:MAG: penicillin-binding transpeptidase domain-containing protein [Clostridia bacterium]|nr:penicillin-binding transpeptidase domain-containing protein [Clostridia bacterium]